MEKILVEIPRELGQALRNSDVKAISRTGNRLVLRALKIKKVSSHQNAEYVTIDNQNFRVRRTTMRVDGYSNVVYIIDTETE